MHLLVVLVLVVGTFLYFPRLAKVLVGLALVGLLVGGLAIAGTLLYQEYVVRPAKEAAATKAAAEAERLRREALAATPAPPSLAERKAAYERWKAENARTTRRTQAIDDLRTVRYEVQDGPARDACLRIPVDFGHPMPERTLLALEAACHPLAAALRAAYERSQRYRPLDGFPTGKDTLGEALYGPRPVAAHPTGLSPDELSRRYFPTGK